MEFILLLGMDFGHYAPQGWVLFTFCGMFMASYVRSRAESSGGLESCSVGIAERKEKMTLLGIRTFCEVLILYDPFKKQWSKIWSDFGPLALAIIIVGFLSHLSAIQRLRYTYIETNKKNE